MVDVAPFVGLRYGPHARLDAVTAPPYDAIDPDLSARLHERDPHNVVRLERAREDAEDAPGADRYSRAAAAYRAWREDGTLRADRRPSLYAYEQRYVVGGRRRIQRGVMAALRVEPWESGRVLPHERVFRGPVEDRLHLLRTVGANLSPVYLLTRREPPAVAQLFERLRGRERDAEFVDPDERSEHRLWVVDDPALIEPVTAAFAGERVLMADGHHRYTTALEHHTAAPERAGSERILAYLVGSNPEAGVFGPTLRPMHRLVRRLPPDAVEVLDRCGFAVRPVRTDGDAVPRVLSALDHAANRGRTAVGLVTRERSALLVAVDDHADALRPDDAAAAVRDLDVTLLQGALTGPLGINDRVEDLAYTADASDAADRVARGEADGLFLLRPIRIDDVWSIAETGALMPPKSTAFTPKPRTGLVIRPLHAV